MVFTFCLATEGKPCWPLSLAKHGKENNSWNHGKCQQSDAKDNRSTLRSSSYGDFSASDVCLAATVLANATTLNPLTPSLREWRLNWREWFVAVGTDLAASHPKEEQPCKKHGKRKQRNPQIVHDELLRLTLHRHCRCGQHRSAYRLHRPPPTGPR